MLVSYIFWTFYFSLILFIIFYGHYIIKAQPDRFLIKGYLKKDLERFLEILPLKYQNLPVKLTSYNSEFSAICAGVFKDGLYLSNRKEKDVLGAFCGTNNKIEIYTWRIFKDIDEKNENPKIDVNFKNQNDLNLFKKLCVFSAFLHEIQHAFQMHYVSPKWILSVTTVIKHENDYKNDWGEINAYNFSSKFLMKNKEKINKLFGINFFWEFKNNLNQISMIYHH